MPIHTPEEPLQKLPVFAVASHWRVIVVGVVQDCQGRYLICRKAGERGVFAGRWGLPGGGIEPGERMGAALRRELREEIGIEVGQVQARFFARTPSPKSPF